MTRVMASVPFWNKNAKRFSNQVVGDVTEHGLDAVTCKINAAGLVNDNNGIRTLFQEAVELRFTAEPRVRVGEPIAQIANPSRAVGGFWPFCR